MNRKKLGRAALTLTAALLAAVTITAAAEPGSSKDPLVTLSYLNDTFLNTILEEVEDRIGRRDRELEEKLGGQLPSGGVSSGSGSAGTFTVVTLTQGQQLVGGVGCEVMLRVGSASCVAASAPGLVNETTGSTLSGGGSLSQNHLYMMTVEDRGVLATAATTKLLVRGDYYIA